MARSTLFGAGLLTLAIVLAASALMRRLAAEPDETPALDEFPAVVSPAAPPKTAPAPAKPRTAALVPPRLLNMDVLQADIRRYYPAAKRRAGASGRVTLSLRVGKDGAVSRAVVQFSGGAEFDAAAKKVVRAMRFSPALRDGRPIAVDISDVVEFAPGG